jgi:NAD(P)-dependent dehydrogenase (short-subunit alcohol dehydrogenase family)
MRTLDRVPYGQCRRRGVRLSKDGADIITAIICEDVDSILYTIGSEVDHRETVQLVEPIACRVVTRKVGVLSSEDMDQALSEGVSELGRLDIVPAKSGIVASGGEGNLSNHRARESGRNGYSCRGMR